MPILINKLTPETKKALGVLSDRYEVLRAKSKGETLRDDKDAVQYVDEVIKRYKTIKATTPTKEALQITRELYLTQLKKHAAELCVLSFSKTGDVASRLQALDVDADTIAEVTKGMEQASGADLLAVFLSSAITSAFSCTGGTHHSHPMQHFHPSRV